MEKETEKIYQIIDSFLVEAKDQNGNERSLQRLNDDRRLAADKFLELIKEVRNEGYKQGVWDEVQCIGTSTAHIRIDSMPLCGPLITE